MCRLLMVLGTLGLAACDQSDSGSSTLPAQPVPSLPTVATTLQFHQLTPQIFVGPRPLPNQIKELTAMGIKKVISVDALPPEASLWTEGIQVRHLPLGYRDLPKPLQLRLARELSIGPVKTYIHCHHGKHRGPAAALAALRNLDQIDPAEAKIWLDRCGVAYQGLRQAVQNAQPESSEDIQSSTPLQEVVATRSLSRLMAEIDQVWDRLKKVPSPSDPKVRTQQEDAAHLLDLFRLSSESAGPVDPAYPKQMQQAIKLATTLEAQLQDGQDAAELRSDLHISCRACHRAFRD
ncbi:MAG: hypothetical protein CMJ37_05295 [Phycisphaerae bacterium]|nr:hypothetical protein [Phycisphaerae bacterium]